VDEVRVAAGSADGFQQAGGALAVELERLVERLLERDGRGAVDDRVDAAGDRQVIVGDVAADHADVGRVETLAGCAREHLLAQALLGVAAEQENHLQVGQLSQDLAEHGLPQEPGGAGEKDRLAGEESLQREGIVGQTATVPGSLLTCQ
jgi:hypothetical protein